MLHRNLAVLTVWALSACGAQEMLTEQPLVPVQTNLELGNRTTVSPLQPTDWEAVAPGVERRVTAAGGVEHRATDMRGLPWFAETIRAELRTTEQKLAQNPSAELKAHADGLRESLGRLAEVRQILPPQDAPSGRERAAHLLCTPWADTNGRMDFCGCDSKKPFAPSVSAYATATWDGCSGASLLTGATEVNVGGLLESSTKTADSGYVYSGKIKPAIEGATYTVWAKATISTTPVSEFWMVRSCKIPDRCPDCADSSDCKDESKPICSYTCAACTADWQCSVKDPTTPFCSRGRCVPCRTHLDCSSSVPICDDRSFCRSCNGDTECRERSASMPFWAQTPLCSGLSHTCVQCEFDHHCGGRTPHCDTSTKTCVP